MCAAPHAAFARASRVAYGGFSPPATLSVIPGKSYATIQLLTYLYGFQVSRVVPGEWPRHQALLSPGVILPRPCRLPPLPPVLKTRSQHISNHTPHLPPTYHALATLTGPRRARAARKAQASSHSLARRDTRNPGALYDSRNPHWQCPYCLVYQQWPPARYDVFPFLYDLFFVCSRFPSVFVPRFSSQNVCTILIQIYNFYESPGRS